MTQFTTMLGDESNIQFGGVQTDEDDTQSFPVQGLICGYFTRGRYDRPMTITQENIRSTLGYDFKNPYYRVVQDVLNEGLPSVQVLRLVNYKDIGTPGPAA